MLAQEEGTVAASGALAEANRERLGTAPGTRLGTKRDLAMNAILKCVFVSVMLFGGIWTAAARVSGTVGPSGAATAGADRGDVSAGVNANSDVRTGGTNTEAGAMLNANADADKGMK